MQFYFAPSGGAKSSTLGLFQQRVELLFLCFPLFTHIALSHFLLLFINTTSPQPLEDASLARLEKLYNFLHYKTMFQTGGGQWGRRCHPLFSDWLFSLRINQLTLDSASLSPRVYPWFFIFIIFYFCYFREIKGTSELYLLPPPQKKQSKTFVSVSEPFWLSSQQTFS